MDQERTMQFILDNLAAVTVRQQQAEARAARTDRQIKGLQDIVRIGMKMMLKLQQGQRQLQEGHKEIQQGHKELQAELKELAAAQKRTDQKFDRWLDTLRSGTNGHNGKKKH